MIITLSNNTFEQMLDTGPAIFFGLTNQTTPFLTSVRMKTF